MENPGGGGHRADSVQLQKLSKPDPTGNWGCWKSVAALRVGAGENFLMRVSKGRPLQTRSALCDSTVNRDFGQLSFPPPATVMGRAGFCGQREWGREAGRLPCAFCPDVQGSVGVDLSGGRKE